MDMVNADAWIGRETATTGGISQHIALQAQATVVSDQFELVSIRPTTLPFMLRRDRATRQEQRFDSI